MLTLADRLKASLDRNPALTQAGLARATGATTASVSNWFTGKTLSLKAANVRLAAQYLGCSTTWLETGLGTPDWTGTPANAGLSTITVAQELSPPYLQTPPLPATQVPVIGTLAKGESNMFDLKAAPDGRPIGVVPAYGTHAPGTFAVRVFGDDLYPTVRHGACLIVSPTAPCQEGELVLLHMATGAYLVCELVSLRADAVTVLPANGGARHTMARADLQAIHPITGVAAGSTFEEAPPG